jgi:hypothetical protein
MLHARGPSLYMSVLTGLHVRLLASYYSPGPDMWICRFHELAAWLILIDGTKSAYRLSKVSYSIGPYTRLASVTGLSFWEDFEMSSVLCVCCRSMSFEGICSLLWLAWLAGCMPAHDQSVCWSWRSYGSHINPNGLSA